MRSRAVTVVLWLALVVALYFWAIFFARIAGADSRTPCIGLDYTNTEHENNNWNTLDHLLCALAQSAAAPCVPPNICDTPPPAPFDLNATDVFAINGIVGAKNSCSLEPGGWFSVSGTGSHALGRMNLGNTIDSLATGRQFFCQFGSYDPISGVGMAQCRPASFNKLGIGTSLPPQTLGAGVAQWQPLTAPAPGLCSPLGQGATFYSTAVNALCFCDGTNWCRVDDALNCGSDDPSTCPAAVGTCQLLAQLQQCPGFCSGVSACPTTTVPTTTTTTTTTTTSTTTTTGAGSTTTTTTTSTTTTTLRDLGVSGFHMAPNFTFPSLVDRFGIEGTMANGATSTAMVIPGHATAKNLKCEYDLDPFDAYHAAHGSNCGGGNPPCPVWTFTVQQSLVPGDQSSFVDSSLSCNSGTSQLFGCEDINGVHDADVKEEAFITIHFTLTSGDVVPTNAACQLVIE